MSKKELTKEKIQQAFWSLYETNRIDKITVKAVCEKAKINRSTFYVYFLDVYDVLDSIESNIFPPATSLPVFDSNSKNTTFNIEEQIIYLREKKKFLKVLLSENGDAAFRFKFIKYIRPAVMAMVKDKSNSVNSNYILEYTLWGIVGVFEYHITNDLEDNEDLLLNTIIELVEKIYY